MKFSYLHDMLLLLDALLLLFLAAQLGLLMFVLDLLEELCLIFHICQIDHCKSLWCHQYVQMTPCQSRQKIATMMPFLLFCQSSPRTHFCFLIILSEWV